VSVETFQPIGSSAIEEATYDSESEDLTVTFTGGDKYLYRNVPSATWRQFQHAGSAGQFHARNIRGRFMYEQV
jgi:hypothetical protein